MTCGCPSIVVGTVHEAEAKLRQFGHEAFELMVIDTGVLGEGGVDLQHQARHLLQTWTEQYSGLPVVFLGTALQKYAVLAAHPVLPPFVTTPFSPHDLMQTVQTLLPDSNQPPQIPPLQTRTTDCMPGGGSMPEPPPGTLPPGGL